MEYVRLRLYLEAASRLFSVQTESKRFPGERKRSDDLLTTVRVQSTSKRTEGTSPYLVGCFQEGYFTLRAQLVFNFIPVSLFIFEQYP